MATLPIVVYPNPILRKKTIAILDVKQAPVQKLIADMLETMEKNNGIGLAAPQVGKNYSLCVLHVDGMDYILINPRITFFSKKKESDIEGCLSFPGKFILVTRSEKIRVKALNENGKKINIKAKGLLARVLQHEIDHLEGKIYLEKENKNHSEKKQLKKI